MGPVDLPKPLRAPDPGAGTPNSDSEEDRPMPAVCRAKTPDDLSLRFDGAVLDHALREPSPGAEGSGGQA